MPKDTFPALLGYGAAKRGRLSQAKAVFIHLILFQVHNVNFCCTDRHFCCFVFHLRKSLYLNACCIRTSEGNLNC